MIKVVLFDVDGVVIEDRKKYFSDRIIEKYGTSADKIDQFFKDQFELAMLGKIDLKEELPKHLKEWNFPGDVEELLQFWWEDEKTPNTQVLHYVDRLKNSGIKCYLASDQEKNRAAFLLENVGLKNHFNGYFISCFMGLRKHDTQFFRYAVDQLKMYEPTEILFWDDKQANLDSANQIGIKTELFSTFEDFRKKMSVKYEL